MHRIVKEADRRAGLSWDVSPHWLRQAHASGRRFAEPLWVTPASQRLGVTDMRDRAIRPGNA